jgi:hypothetical protein
MLVYHLLQEVIIKFFIYKYIILVIMIILYLGNSYYGGNG